VLEVTLAVVPAVFAPSVTTSVCVLAFQVIVDLLVRMAQRDAERMAISSDNILQNLRLQRQESSLQKIEKYEQIADKLIAGDLTDGVRDQLEQEYRIVKNQLNYHLIPLKNNPKVSSWNSQMLNNKLGATAARSSIPADLDFGKTFSVNSRRRRDTFLPNIGSPNKGDSTDAVSDTQSDFGTEHPSGTVGQLPNISRR